MSYRKMMYIAVLFILLTTTGCSLFHFVDNSSPEDIRKFETSKDDLWNQKKALEQENAANQKQLADQQAHIILMNRSMSEQQSKIAQANRLIDESSKIIEDLNVQIKQLGEEREKTVKAVELVEPKKVKETPTKTIRGPKKEARKKQAEALAASETKVVKIKVLAGDGNIASARRMAKRLVKMGYRVKLIDRAERSDFALNTVYHAVDYGVAADDIVKKLGGNTISLPLTWQSIFDLIIVTGREP
ncbi:MAG: hypothetical protein C0390_05995 [Syntrophus sp. (in: bacteria)]|nr:hypothetical protein [Syntrophus sp. (in: bacteria)]